MTDALPAHSNIGPSALHRLLACPGSHQLSQAIPVPSGGRSSPAAAQGTVAHGIVESLLLDDWADAPEVGTVVTEDGHDITVDRDMLDGVDFMVNVCRGLMMGAEKHWVEEKFSLDKLWNGTPPEPIFGTVDFAAWHPAINTLHVVDFKYGFLPVSPHNNPQAHAYALGAVYELGVVPEWVTMTIIQPRGEGQTHKTAAIHGMDLLLWADDTLKPGVDALYGPSPTLNTGEHCRFCAAKSQCPALYKKAQDATLTQFPGLPPAPMTLDDKQLAMVLDQTVVIDMWVKAIQAEATGRLERGDAVEGWELVPKRATRRYTDEAKVAAVLEELAGDEMFSRKVLSPAQVEKVSKTAYAELEKEGLVEKVSSGTTLAADSDPRARIEGRMGSDDFDVIGADDDGMLNF